jgi:hypothetical protein
VGNPEGPWLRGSQIAVRNLVFTRRKAAA